MRYHPSPRSLMLVSCSVLLVTLQFLATPSTTHAVTRDPLHWPFAPTSIWNMPIGSNARYVDTTINSRGFGTDIDWFVTTQNSDPEVPNYTAPTFGQGRCAGTLPQQQAQWHPEAAQPMHIPTNLIIPDAITSGGTYWTPNSSAAFLQPDGKTIVSINTAARCQPGGPLYGSWFGLSDLYGDGIAGGHGGSAMSSIGGSIRTGELLDDQPIRHALKIDLWGNWLYYNAGSGQGHRWPAPLADGGAPNQYKGSNPALVMGSLLALPTSASPESLGLTSAIGKKIFQAFQNYGAYIVDDTGGDYNALCVEQNADIEFKNATGHPVNQDQGLIADFNKMIPAAKVIDNNGPDAIGGGGTPRMPLAPDFGAPVFDVVPPGPTVPTQAVVVPTATPLPPTPTPTAVTPPREGKVDMAVGVVGSKSPTGVGSLNAPVGTKQGKILVQKARSGGFPWGWLVLPVSLLAAGGGGWYWWQRRRADKKVIV